MALTTARLKKTVLIVVYLSLFVALLLYARPAPRQTRPATPSFADATRESSAHAADSESRCRASDARVADLQRRHQLQTPFQYLRRAIHLVRSSEVRRSSLTKLPQKLLDDDFQTIDVENPGRRNEEPSCADPIQATVSASGFPQNVDASGLIFGVSTTFDRFSSSAAILIQDWSFWLTDGSRNSNGAKLILMLLDASPEQLQEVKSTLSKAGIDADTHASDASLSMAARNMALIPAMYGHAGAAKKKWFVLCDDDTFFPNMHALIAKLAEHDDSTDKYIGALSEDALALEKHGTQAFGGAGIFLSRPTAEKMAADFGQCSSPEKVRQAGEQGDRLLRQCLEQHGIQLTALGDLWQLDTFGDPAGFYEWGTKPLSLHHYRSWHHAAPGDLAKMAYLCGEDCTLQRFLTSDHFIMSGYSVAQYPAGITFDANQAERTFGAETDKGWNFDYKMGPQRPSLSGTGKKMAWQLREAEFQQDGSLLQTYVRMANDTRWVDSQGKPMSEYDGVIELVWTCDG